MVTTVKHHILQDGITQTKPFILCFCFANSYDYYKYTPLFSHTIKDNMFAFVGEVGQIFFFPQEKLRDYSDYIVRKYLNKINRDWQHSDNKLIVPFSHPEAVNFSAPPR